MTGFKRLHGIGWGGILISNDIDIRSLKGSKSHRATYSLELRE